MSRRLPAVIALCALLWCAGALASGRTRAAGVRHYEYIAAPGVLYAYDIDRLPSLVAQFPLAGVQEIRGIAASAATGMLYISYGGFPSGAGHLLEFSLYRRRIVYSRSYPFGIDSFDITHDGRLIFMPTGENTTGRTWHVLSATSGRVLGAIAAGRAPHDTAVSSDGRYVFLGGASSPYLYMAAAARPWRVLRRIGPLEPAGIRGIRPFTINAQDSLAFTTGDRFVGFQVSDVATGRVLYTVPVRGFAMPPTYTGLVASHGIGLSPDQRFLWVVDEPHDAVHEFDVSGLPRRPPALVATVPVSGSPGWLNLSRDGRYVFVGGSSTVIDAATRRPVATIPALLGSVYNIEVDWSGGRVCAAYPRESLGYLHVAARCPA